MGKQAKIMPMLLVLALVGSVSARVITVEVEGVVTHINTGGGFALDGSVIIGSEMTGTATYDTETPDEYPANEDVGVYPVISISMTIGNYIFEHDLISADFPYFGVGTVDPSYDVTSPAPRFNGTIYVNGTPKTYDDITWGYTYLVLFDFLTSSGEYVPTDALPDLDSWPDLSVFDYRREFRARFFGEGSDYFNIYGEITSLTVIPEPAKTYYVNAAEGSDDNDGLSKETPFATIQKAIDSAFNGDTVIVADGTYTGPGNRDIDFLGKAITVRSENGPENCIIDCNATETDRHRGFKFHLGESPNSVVAGFTITNGYGPSDYIQGPHRSCAGGAIYCSASSPVISNCILIGNSASNGGGICCCEGSSPIVKNCTIVNNFAFGGGMYCLFSAPEITNCIISSNKGGIVCEVSSPTIYNCIISGNYGGSGGISCYRGNPIIYNCTITGNSSGGYWGGIRCYSDCIMTVSSCVLWDNWPRQITGNVSVTYSDVQNGWEGQGNIDTDPCFVEPGYWADANDPNIVVEPNDPNAIWIEGDYYLLPDSLCINTGDPNYVPEPNETDLDGNPRVIGGRIDMGAYESNYIQAAMKLTPQMLNCNSRGNWVKARFVLPEGFLPEDVDVNEPAIAEPIGIESEYIKVLGNDDGPVRLEVAFGREAFCDGLTETGEVEVTVIGSLTTGRYFYGSDTIRIKP